MSICYKVQTDTVRPGKSTELAMRVYSNDGPNVEYVSSQVSYPNPSVRLEPIIYKLFAFSRTQQMLCHEKVFVVSMVNYKLTRVLLEVRNV